MSLLKERRIALLNPNTNVATTNLMTRIAQSQVSEHVRVTGYSMLLGPMVVTDEDALNKAAIQIVKMGQTLAADGVDGLLISGFGDPGLETLRETLDIPVTGIAEAGMAAAAVNGRHFSIVTTTPDLTASIAQLARRYGYEKQLSSIRLTQGKPEVTMASHKALSEALLQTIRSLETEEDTDAVLIGGGPLAAAAAAIADRISLPIIEPVSEGAKLASLRICHAESGFN